MAVFFHEPEQLVDGEQTPEELIHSVHTQRNDLPGFGACKEHQTTSCRRTLRQILLNAPDLVVEGFPFGFFHVCFAVKTGGAACDKDSTSLASSVSEVPDDPVRHGVRRCKSTGTKLKGRNAGRSPG